MVYMPRSMGVAFIAASKSPPVAERAHPLDWAIAWADAYPERNTAAYSPALQSVARVRIAQHQAYGEPDLGPVLAALDTQGALTRTLPHRIVTLSAAKGLVPHQRDSSLRSE
jgi:hypothetical protein